MKNDIIIQKYTRALFEIADENGVLEDVQKGLQRIDSTFKSLPELEEYLTSPQIDWKLKSEIVVNLSKGLSEYIVNFTKVVLEKERQIILPQVPEHFQRMLDLRAKRSKAVLTTVVPASEDVKKQLQNKLKQIFGEEFVLENEIDPDIIGGMKVRMGYTVIDGTIKRKLEELSRLLAKG